MEKMQKIREPLSNFQHGRGATIKVYHACVSDDISGLRILSGSLENSANLENSRLSYVKHGGDHNELIGVTRTHFDPVLDVVFLGVLTLEPNFHVISNDAFAARELMIKTLFGTRENFNRQVGGLQFFEEWTDSQRFIRPLMATVDELMPFTKG